MIQPPTKKRALSNAVDDSPTFQLCKQPLGHSQAQPGSTNKSENDAEQGPAEALDGNSSSESFSENPACQDPVTNSNSSGNIERDPQCNNKSPFLDSPLSQKTASSGTDLQGKPSTSFNQGSQLAHLDLAADFAGISSTDPPPNAAKIMKTMSLGNSAPRTSLEKTPSRAL